MTKLMQRVYDFWLPMAGQVEFEPSSRVSPAAHRPHGREHIARYRTQIELRELLQTFAEPARTTVVLVLDWQMAVHLPTLLKRDSFALRLILTSPSGQLHSATSRGDLALHGRGWGWNSIAYLRDLPQALATARETTAVDELLLVLWPDWLPLDA